MIMLPMSSLCDSRYRGLRSKWRLRERTYRSAGGWRRASAALSRMESVGTSGRKRMLVNSMNSFCKNQSLLDYRQEEEESTA